MQSSFGLAIRAAIMLLFLVTIPLWAIFGKAFPEVVRIAADKYLPVKIQALADLSPAFTPEREKAPSWNGRPEDRTPNGDSPRLKVDPLVPGSPPEAAPPNDGLFVPPPAPSGTKGGPPNPGLNLDIQPPSPQPLPPATPAPGVGQVALSYEEMQQQLKQLGATWFRMEQNDEQAQFRMTCHAEVVPNSPAVRQFEAIHTTREQALADVLSQLQRYRSETARF